MRGFTLIEMVVVVAILVLVVYMVTGAYSNFLDGQRLNSAVEGTVSLIQKARGDTLSSKNNSFYSIHVEDTNSTSALGKNYLEMFKANDYWVSSKRIEKYSMPNTIEISQVALQTSQATPSPPSCGGFGQQCGSGTSCPSCTDSVNNICDASFCKNTPPTRYYAFVPDNTGTTRRVKIIDTTADPPQLVNTITICSSSCGSVTLSAINIYDNQVYVTGGANRLLYKFPVPSPITTGVSISNYTVGSSGENIGDVYINSQYVYIMAGWDGNNGSASNIYRYNAFTMILDKSTTGFAPGTLDNAANSMDVVGEMVYIVTANSNKFHIIDFLASPTVKNGSGTALGGSGRKISVNGSSAYILYNGGFRKYNVSNPASPSLVGSSIGVGSITRGSMFAEGNYAYIVGNSTPNNSIVVINISGNPVKVSNDAFSIGASRAIYVVNQVAYTTPCCSSTYTNFYGTQFSNGINPQTLRSFQINSVQSEIYDIHVIGIMDTPQPLTCGSGQGEAGQACCSGTPNYCTGAGLVCYGGFCSTVPPTTGKDITYQRLTGDFYFGSANPLVPTSTSPVSGSITIRSTRSGKTKTINFYPTGTIQVQ